MVNMGNSSHCFLLPEWLFELYLLIRILIILLRRLIRLEEQFFYLTNYNFSLNLKKNFVHNRNVENFKQVRFLLLQNLVPLAQTFSRGLIKTLCGKFIFWWRKISVIVFYHYLSHKREFSILNNNQIQVSHRNSS